jgi:poly(3-hydroxybutyrate) depolymerase
VLRGIAPVSGGGPFGGSCSGNVAVWAAHGADDETVDVMLGQDSVEGWTTRNGCDFATSSPVEPSPCVEYGSCQSGFPVRYCEYAGGHEWPDFAPQALWNFFKSL